MGSNTRGIVMMIFAMALFSLEDLFIKISAADLPVGQVLVILGLGGVLVFAILVKRRGEALFPRELLHPAVILRNLGELIGTVGYVTALALTELSSAASILQAMPLVVTMGAALFLGEQVGWRRWSAITVGFIGVLIILRPGLDGFEPASLFAVLGVIGLSLRDLATRRVPASVSALQLSVYGFAMVIPAGIVLLLSGQETAALTQTHMIWLGFAILFGATGYYAIVEASRYGDVSIITPFRYSRIIFAMVLAVVVLGETVEPHTLIGAALIIGSGLYTFARERAVKAG